MTELKWGDRRYRPSPRPGLTWEPSVGGRKLFVRSGEFEDGSLCEVFINVGRQGDQLQAQLNGFAVALSLALQHGTPLAELVSAYRHTKFDPCGPVAGDSEIRWASSVFDYIAHRLELTYLPPAVLTVPEPDAATETKAEGDPPPPEKVAGRRTAGSGW